MHANGIAKYEKHETYSALMIYCSETNLDYISSLYTIFSVLISLLRKTKKVVVVELLGNYLIRINTSVQLSDGLLENNMKT